MAVVAMTREMGSLGSPIAQEVARRLGYEFLRNDLLRDAAKEYRVRESRLVGVVEQAPGLVERLGRPRLRYRSYLEAVVLEAALQDRVVLVGRWSTLFLRGIGHAMRVRVCAPADVRARRVMERHGIDATRRRRRIAAYDDGVRARMRQMFDVDWTDPLLYDLVINTGAVGVATAVGQVLELVAAPEFQPTAASRQLLADRALAARLRAILKATPRDSAGGSRHPGDGGSGAAGGSRRLGGRAGGRAGGRSRGAGGEGCDSEVKVFRRPVR